jgi:hypothetical protein
LKQGKNRGHPEKGRKNQATETAAKNSMSTTSARLDHQLVFGDVAGEEFADLSEDAAAFWLRECKKKWKENQA